MMGIILGLFMLVMLCYYALPLVLVASAVFGMPPCEYQGRTPNLAPPQFEHSILVEKVTKETGPIPEVEAWRHNGRLYVRINNDLKFAHWEITTPGLSNTTRTWIWEPSIVGGIGRCNHPHTYACYTQATEGVFLGVVCDGATCTPHRYPFSVPPAYLENEDPNWAIVIPLLLIVSLVGARLIQLWRYGSLS